MKPYLATAILSVILVAMSAWGYLGSETPSFTALIPAGFGVVLALCIPGVKKENKIAAHVAVVLVLVLILALFMPLKGAIGRGDTLAIVRVAVMLLAAIGTFVTYILSFVQARRDRAASE